MKFKPGDVITLRLYEHREEYYRDLVVTKEEYYNNCKDDKDFGIDNEDEIIYTKSIAYFDMAKKWISYEANKPEYWKVSLVKYKDLIKLDEEYMKEQKLKKEVKDWLD